jgi:ABC-type branched-subunit amino acid transport system permease subunit
MKAIVIVIAALLVGGAAAVCLFAPGYYAYLLGTLATTALVGVGLNVLLGLTGEVSLGQGGFLALGAYGVGILTTKAGLNFWEALPLAVLLVAAVSAVLSIPALRVTGPYLAMVTIAFGFIVESVSVEWRGLTGGASGLAGIPAPFGTGGTALLACGFCALALALFHIFARSPLGLAMQATASAPAAARSI